MRLLETNEFMLCVVVVFFLWSLCSNWRTRLCFTRGRFGVHAAGCYGCSVYWDLHGPGVQEAETKELRSKALGQG